MTPLVQALNNFFMLSLLHICVLFIGWGFAWIIRKTDDEGGSKMLEMINSMFKFFSVKLVIITIIVSIIAVEVLSYILSEDLFSIIGGIVAMCPLILSGALGFRCEMLYFKKKGSLKKQQ